MLYVQHNLLAQNANRQLKATTDKNAKTTEKLSSGYRINRAADDAAGLSISEKMRRQVRGLMQGTANAKDGISYVQVADGAMNEGHDILQRMNELALKSLNGTLTEADRAALNAEFDQLRTEIDRINTETEFNGRKVFDEHEPSYYQLLGNRKWEDDQLHTVSGISNDLTINLPDEYVPNEYSITVPPGVYTTQELVDEIDDALESMRPANPGFVFEYTDRGYCNLNFENPTDLPAMIDSVEGSLAYLLYDLYSGNTTGDLIGTGEFPLQIYSGYNDTLGFYVEGVAKEISMTIPPGNYTREEMIRKINEELAKHPEAAGVKAEEYGDANIQLTGGRGVSITGLKGNMFRWESYTEKYSSAFYDNLQYGISTGGTAGISGSAYYSSATAKINITAGANDTLRFKINGAAGYTDIKIPAGKYTIAELASKLNGLFKDKGIDKEITASTGTNTSVYPYREYLILRNTLTGTKSTLEFDKTSQSVYKDTYDTLFRDTNYYPNSSSSGKQKAYLIGAAYLTSSISLPQSSLTFSVDGTSYTLDGLKTTYSGLDELVNALNTRLEGKYSNLKDKIKFQNSSNRIQIAAQSDDIKKIDISSSNQEAIYNLLFTRKQTYTNSLNPSSQYGYIENVQQGTSETKVTSEPYYSVRLQNQQITIKGSHNKISFTTSRGNGEISLDAKTYTIDELVGEINKKLHVPGNPEGLRNITAVYENGRLKFESEMPKDFPKYTQYWVSSNVNDSNSAWNDIAGTYEQTYTHSSQQGYGASATLTTYSAIAENITINGSNNTLTLKLESGETTINIAQASYTSREALKNAVQNAIDNTALKGKVTVSVTNDNKLRFFTSEGKMEASGSFYDSVLISKIAGNPSETNKGSYSYTPSFIIGRKDLTQQPIDIISNANDEFIFDFAYYKSVATYSPLPGTPDQDWSPIKVTIPEGTYGGEEIAAILTKKIQEAFNAKNLNDFEVKVMVNDPSGIASTNSEFDKTALKIVVNRKNNAVEPDAGMYVLDGVRGSAASFIFYKTTGTPRATYITGTKDLTNGVMFEPGKNVLTLSADSVPYQYTFPENVLLSPDELAAFMNDKFANGDDNGNTAPLTAEIENGVLKITHKAVGSHTISDVGGSARSTVFFQEKGRDTREPLNILVTGETGNNIEIPKVSIGSCAIRINSITISKPKYAEKAVRRIKDAINILSSKRSTYGALQNRMEHTVNNNENIIENTQASESAIRDADVADLMMEFSINNILLQAGTSMLAQANQSAQLIMGLLH